MGDNGKDVFSGHREFCGFEAAGLRVEDVVIRLYARF
jgi:hypothetical protein